MNPLERKEKSIEILKANKVPYMEGLPVIEDANEIEMRSVEEIAKRAIACLISIQVACDINSGENIKESREFFEGFLEKYKVKEELTDNEKEIIFGSPDIQEVINMAWKYEAYWTLIWALGIVDKLEYPSQICDCNFAICAVADYEDFNDFMKTVKLRSIEEILDEADLIYRYNWACVNARIHGENPPAGLNPGVVFERHWGLNWLIGKGTYNDNWDSVSTDT
ncbi:hypothetical protein U732_3302 [Clostridium argentinense CDC 2741]|uniref:DUF4272 domain-containing protein n=1 Tax=Clostridium argentinense CDC 2741 TaxID=1418104 RepID=A0A0C1UGT8_9CLOT|nr:DUF4272 domain-containing protein [Clostridium argentinense]ARC86505.1 hypothetical protein RSJ17_19430 [Clostridium argentinense]KIE46620.1 hypothetical protein U732_3302 [Clostridium argentinense CDC 2741]NFF37969.1 DUF4272 domain-containing protein [Clostridium argentinense]NFP49951.1 DUF4272 domain-containing protein [Clostridium argentinense]NFP71361.1 DUF4272 domain-containing protein [Clostridium argentinense]